MTAKLITKPISYYSGLCDDTFACPDSLQGRISFWVDVFSRWDTNTAIFHDKEKPERVYSTIKRKEGCRHSKKGDAIGQQRKYLKQLILKTADRIRAGQSLTQAQIKIANQFVGASTRDMKAAAGRIRCQSGNKDRMKTALMHFHQYQPTILDALQKYGLSPEIQYLPFVESAFNPDALSHVGAAGLWQIMPATGKKLGLLVNDGIDERYDPFRASYAAARYFRNSVDTLSATAQQQGEQTTPKALYPFVVTSYNYGVKGMQRAIAKVGLDYERLLTEYKSPYFQTAVKNFYASFLGARYVAKNASTWFGELEPNFQYKLKPHNNIKLDRATSLTRMVNSLNVKQPILKRFNPAITKRALKGKTLLSKGYLLRLPYKKSGWGNELAVMAALPKERQYPSYSWHKVRPGQTACGIAEHYRASCRALKKLNKLNNKATIYAGQRLKIPGKHGIRYAANGVGGSYTVKRGDSACLIANRFNMKCRHFLAANGLNYNSVLPAGKTVKVTGSRAWHTVARGQTACGIASNYNVSCVKLLAANRLKRNSTIHIGQRLLIPSKG